MVNEFSKHINTDHIRFKYAKGMRDIIGNEFHSYHEIFFFIAGNAEFISETCTERLVPFTVVIIPKETFHCFVVHGEEKEYCRCVLNFDDVPQLDELIESKMVKIALSKNEKLYELFMQLKDLPELDCSKLEKSVLLHSLFAQILVYIQTQSEQKLTSDIHAVTRQAIECIDRNIDGALSAHELASQLHVSSSYLAHIFKKDLHISIHKYILEKRLVLAHKMIKKCESPMTVAMECGFSDYSGFYRQYKKMFGVAPSKHKSK